MIKELICYFEAKNEILETLHRTVITVNTILNCLNKSKTPGNGFQLENKNVLVFLVKIF